MGLLIARLPATELPGVLRVPEAPELLAAGLPVAGLLAGLPGTALAAPEPPEAVATDATGAVAPDTGDPPEARSCCDPAPAAGAVGCSEVAGGRASVEVDLSACVGF